MSEQEQLRHLTDEEYQQLKPRMTAEERLLEGIFGGLPADEIETIKARSEEDYARKICKNR